MEGFEERGGSSQTSELRDQSIDSATLAEVGRSALQQFDALQYVFFGKELTEEVELGGLEDEDDDVGHLGGYDNEKYESSFVSDQEQVEEFKAGSEVDGVSELSESFVKLNMMSRVTRQWDNIRDSRFPDSEFSQAECLSVTDAPVPERAPEVNFFNWIDHQILDSEPEQEGKKGWPQQQIPPMPAAEGNNVYRPSTYSQQQQWLGDLGFPQTSFNLYSSIRSPFLGQLNRPPPCLLGQASLGGPQIPHSPVSRPCIRGYFSSLPEYGRGMPEFSASGHVINTPPHQQVHWLNPVNFCPGGPSAFDPNLMQQQMIQPNVQVPAEVPLQHQRLKSIEIGGPPFLPVQTHKMFGTISSIPHMMQKPGEAPYCGDFRYQRQEPQQHAKRNQRHYQQNSDTNSHSGRSSNGWQQFHSKYMTAEEIERIVRMQVAATSCNDPYVDDYYHEAVLAKNTGSNPGKHCFAPSALREFPSCTWATVEPHAFLQLDTPGRVPFSSVCRPHPFLEVNMQYTSILPGNIIRESNSRNRPLKQESMLAVRIFVEDGLCLLLDVDDIDRVLQVSPYSDDGALRRKRQILLEGLAASLQLVDPLVAHKGDHSGGLAPKDDLVFLHVVSLPKGRKLLSKYMDLLTSGSELARIVSMAVFRHLRFLFGGLPVDSSAAATTTNLAKTLSSCVRKMDLSALSACLAAVVCSSEQPPLRPLGNSAGDGASVILMAVLERATNLLIDSHSSYNVSNRALWQASFDAFFALLSTYCTNKYDSIMDSLNIASEISAAVRSAAVLAMNKEMPVELLRASIPHTNEHQQKLLLELTQRSMPIGGLNSHDLGDGRLNTAAVPG